VVEGGIPGENGEIVNYHSCPRKFIPRSCAEFFELWQFREREFPHTMPSWEKLDKRYIAFRRYFLSVLSEYEGALKQ
jgi:hypothetical protein